MRCGICEGVIGHRGFLLSSKVQAVQRRRSSGRAGVEVSAVSQGMCFHVLHCASTPRICNPRHIHLSPRLILLPTPQVTGSAGLSDGNATIWLTAFKGAAQSIIGASPSEFYRLLEATSKEKMCLGCDLQDIAAQGGLPRGPR